jgi:hypothetical protein
MRASLEQAEKLFVPTPAASCKLKKVEVHSPLLGDESEHEPGRDEHDGHEGHADLDGTFELACAHPERLRDLEVRLFDAFPNLKKVKVAVVAPKGQKAGELTLTDNRIAW